MAHRLFEGSVHAANYSKFRPTYPHDIFERIIGFMKEQAGFSPGLAVDIGCGSGQSTRPLAEYFTKVIGIDISPAQVDTANKNEKLPNVEYKVGSEQEIPVASSSVDLVTAAQAAHWFDPIQKFYNEAHRVLKPNGCLVLYGYGTPTLQNNANGKELQGIFSEFYKSMWDGCYWHERRKMVDNLYKDFDLPYSLTQRLDDEMSTDMNLHLLIGYVGTWSAYQKHQKENPDVNILQPLLQRFHETFPGSVSPDDAIVKVTWPLFVLIGKKEGKQ